jgi:hypothetical protein
VPLSVTWFVLSVLHVQLAILVLFLHGAELGSLWVSLASMMARRCIGAAEHGGAVQGDSQMVPAVGVVCRQRRIGYVLNWSLAKIVDEWKYERLFARSKSALLFLAAANANNITLKYFRSVSLQLYYASLSINSSRKYSIQDIREYMFYLKEAADKEQMHVCNRFF